MTLTALLKHAMDSIRYQGEHYIPAVRCANEQRAHSREYLFEDGLALHQCLTSLDASGACPGDLIHESVFEAFGYSRDEDAFELLTIAPEAWTLHTAGEVEDKAFRVWTLELQKTFHVAVAWRDDEEMEVAVLAFRTEDGV